MNLIGWFFLVVITLGAVVNDGCASKVSVRNGANMAENMDDLEKLSGLKLPAAAKILTKIDEGGHDGTKFKKWIVLAPEKFSLLGTVIDGDDNATFLKTIEETMPNEPVGKPVGKQYQFSDWRNEQGQWQAAAVETDQGFYLSLENVVLD